MKQITMLLPLLLFLYGCGEDPAGPNASLGSVNITINHAFADKEFVLGTTYQLANGESISCSMLRYYLSNVTLERADGSMHVIPQDSSYKLIDMSVPSSLNFSFPNIPAGTYTAVYIVVGVDSLRSTMGLDKRTGVLDIGAAAQDMYWSWNQGYIHFKFEGTYASGSATGGIRYHVGGFGGYSTQTINCIRSVRINLASKPCIISGNQSTTLHLAADVNKIFTGKEAISVATNNSVMFAPYATTIADNYATMFSHLVKD